MSIEEQRRKDFEAFHRTHMEGLGFDQDDIDSEFDRDESGNYIYTMAADGWIYWNAALNSQVVCLPFKQLHPEEDHRSKVIDECASFLRRQGVTVAGE